MTEQSYRLVPWTITALLVAAIPHALHLPIHISLIIATLLVWRLFLHRRFLRMPPNWLKAVLAIATFAIVLMTFKSINGVAAGSALLICMVSIKSFELNTLRDHASLILASFFIIVSFVLDDTSIWSGVYLLIATAMSTLALLKLSAPSLELSQLIPTAKKFLFFGIPLTIVLFLLFPRIPGPLWGLPNSSQAKSGLSDSMSPGSITNLIRSDELAFRARFINKEPERKDLYWRGPVLHEFDGSTWENRSSFFPSNILPASNPNAIIDYEVIQEPTNKRWFYVLDHARQLPDDAYLIYDYQVMRERPIVQLTRFTASAQLGQTNLMTDKERRLAIQRDLRLPANTAPRTKALVGQWRQQYQRDMDIVNAAFAHFNKEIYSYTLRPQALDMSKPVDDFLFRTKQGFCEHYASAFVVMMRHAGIPARVVTGYLGGEKNLLDGYYRVTQADAHAWTEVYLEDRGWTRVDPTAAIAPERIEQRLEDLLPGENLGGLFGNVPLFLRLESAWFALNTAWYNLVLDFNAEKQLDFLKRLGFKDPNWQSLIWLLVSGILLTTLFMSFTFWRQARKTVADPIQKLYLKLQKRLYKKGLLPISGEGPKKFGLRAANEFKQKSGLIDDFISEYIQSRYQNRKFDKSNINKLKSLLKAI